jgi:hypothetical protein
MKGGIITANAPILVADATRWIAVYANNIPSTLREKPHWVIWRAASRDGNEDSAPRQRAGRKGQHHGARLVDHVPDGYGGLRAGQGGRGRHCAHR